MKIAIIHDHLNQMGGAEYVLQVMHRLWPEAPLFTLQYDRRKIGDAFKDIDIRTSFIDRLPGSHRWFQWTLPLMPSATESYNLSEFDVVISNSSAFSKGVITRPETLHLCYCHTPTRYLWSDTKEYLEHLRQPAFIKALLPPLLSYLRTWDRMAADRVDTFFANSQTVAWRIQKYYRRPSTILHPPVATHQFNISNAPKNYYLIGGRLVPYKRYDLVVDACSHLGVPLKVFGTGPVEADLKKRAGKTVEFLGRVSESEKADLYANAIAFLHPQEEDFGITPIESMASGRPVIAWRRGGAMETIKEDVTGTFFDIQDWECLASTLMRFDHTRFDPQIIRQHAEQFSEERFGATFKAHVTSAYKQHLAQLHTPL